MNDDGEGAMEVRRCFWKRERVLVLSVSFSFLKPARLTLFLSMLPSQSLVWVPQMCRFDEMVCIVLSI